MGALGLYCDLLSMPDVLKPEHRHYAEDVRLLGERSMAMIQELMEHSLRPLHTQNGATCSWLQAPVRVASPGQMGLRSGSPETRLGSEHEAKPISLRGIVEHCSGLLSRVAGGRTIEISYGAAASVPVRLAEEVVERILVNLVRNAAAALNRRGATGNGMRVARGQDAGMQGPAQSVEACTPGCVCGAPADCTAEAIPGAILISVGLLLDRVGEPKPWPFERVRLTVEDAGCGMSVEQVDRLLSASSAPSRGSHGIGFRVVQDLVAASNGYLKVMSAPGIGTWVQLEWPMAAGADPARRVDEFQTGLEKRLTC